MGKKREITFCRCDHHYGRSPAKFWSMASDSIEYTWPWTHPMLIYSHICIKLAIQKTHICHKSIKLTCLLVSLRFSHYSALKNKILLERALSLTPVDRKSHCWTELLLLEINASPHHCKSLQDQSFHELIFCWCMSHKIIQLPFCGCTGSSKLAGGKKSTKNFFHSVD